MFNSNIDIDKIQKREIALEEVHRLAFKYEKEYHYCSQCTVAALQEVFQIKSKDKRKEYEGK